MSRFSKGTRKKKLPQTSTLITSSPFIKAQRARLEARQGRGRGGRRGPTRGRGRGASASAADAASTEGSRDLMLGGGDETPPAGKQKGSKRGAAADVTSSESEDEADKMRRELLSDEDDDMNPFQLTMPYSKLTSHLCKVHKEVADLESADHKFYAVFYPQKVYIGQLRKVFSYDPDLPNDTAAFKYLAQNVLDNTFTWPATPDQDDNMPIRIRYIMFGPLKANQSGGRNIKFRFSELENVKVVWANFLQHEERLADDDAWEPEGAKNPQSSPMTLSARPGDSGSPSGGSGGPPGGSGSADTCSTAADTAEDVVSA